ncbi:MAG: polysaccharide biosynthesis C-terminal domain-containing protein [Acutalibacteraceae bacterium]
MIGLLYLFIRYKRLGFGFTREEIVNSPPAQSDKSIRKDIIRIAAPVALSSVILNISNMIDDTTIRTRLAHAIEVGGDTIKQMYASSFEAAQTLDSGIANYLYGTHGSVINIKNLIPTITLTLGISAIPVLSKAWTRKDTVAIKSTIESVLRVTMMIALPAGFGMAALAKPILKLLYSSQQDMIPVAEPMLIIYGIFLFLFSVTSPVTNMLQAIGRTDIPVKTIAIGSVVKIVLNFILIGNPGINIHGAPVSTTICYALMITINLISIIKITGAKINFISVFLKPFIAAAACGLSAYFSYFIISEKLGIGNTISTVISICVGAFFYAVVLLLIKGLARTDLEMIPKGEKIAKVLEKFKLLG